MEFRSLTAAASWLEEQARADRSIRVVGATDEARAVVLARLAQGARPLLWIVRDEVAAGRAAAALAFVRGERPPAPLSCDRSILVVPEVDTSPYGDLAADPRVIAARFAACARCSSASPPQVVIASVRALWTRVMPREIFAALRTTWHVGDEIGHEAAIATLVRCGYSRVDVVEDPGTYAVRGGVIDAYLPGMSQPIRIDWFGDEVERLRTFDPLTQRSEQVVQSCEVIPVRATLPTAGEGVRPAILQVADAHAVPSTRVRHVLDCLESGQELFGIEALVPCLHGELEPLWHYLPADTPVIIDDPDGLTAVADSLDAELQQGYGQACAERRLVCAPEALALDAWTWQEFIGGASVRFDAVDRGPEAEQQTTLRVIPERDDRLLLELQAARGRKHGELFAPVVAKIRDLSVDPPWSVVVASPNRTHADRMVALLRDHGLDVDAPRVVEDVPALCVAPQQGATRVCVVIAELAQGWICSEERLWVIAEADVFGPMARRSEPRRPRPSQIGLGQLAQGDYVVHVTHGVGRYVALVQLALGGVTGDFVHLEYSGGDRLYLPVTRLGEIERYVSAEAKPPKLDKMGGVSFASKTARVKAEVRQIAEELLQIYAQREAMGGHAHPPGGEPYREFEATFAFEETPDQESAIAAVQADLGRERPMDRLVCGDVGFGKTEVALRAAFRVASGGKQVAVLAPTTILVQQHFRTFGERMAPFGLKVGVLSRFTDAKTRAQCVAGVKSGAVDVVVGTHRLLSSDVRFRDLGLVIIDEEQRFGVAQKERFKRLKTEVDVLTMSATPIPRTLHMSLLGLREISLIMTPPGDRLAVRTFLTRPSDAVLRDGITKELARGGQIFYVVPRVMGIEEHAVRLRKIVPEARIRVAHGQMPAQMLEETMFALLEHEIDVLVATTIIESGLDIPRANTMFVAEADHFGLAQLYQLRGRIGRSRHRAFCYLMVESMEKLQPDARRRLEAMARYSELGGGYSVASHDLETRGAGEILGARQSGQIQAIGFEAYSRTLQEAVAELRGQPILREQDPELIFDLPAFLPEAYVEDTGTRLDFYRRLSVAHDRDTVEAIIEEIHDRFGELPPEGRCLGHVMACKTYGRRLAATTIELRGERLTVRLGEHTHLDRQFALELDKRTKGQIKLASADRIVARIEGGGDETRLRRCTDALAQLCLGIRDANGLRQ